MPHSEIDFVAIENAFTWAGSKRRGKRILGKELASWGTADSDDWLGTEFVRSGMFALGGCHSDVGIDRESMGRPDPESLFLGRLSIDAFGLGCCSDTDRAADRPCSPREGRGLTTGKSLHTTEALSPFAPEFCLSIWQVAGEKPRFWTCPVLWLANFPANSPVRGSSNPVNLKQYVDRRTGTRPEFALPTESTWPDVSRVIRLTTSDRWGFSRGVPRARPHRPFPVWE